MNCSICSPVRNRLDLGCYGILSTLNVVVVGIVGYLLFPALLNAAADDYRAKQTNDPAYSITDVPADWALTRIKAQMAWSAWRASTVAGGRIVAVLDGEFDIGHLELTPNIWNNQAEVDGVPERDDDNNGYTNDFHGWDFVDNTNLTALNSSSQDPHGTFVAGIIAANHSNNEGTAGVAPNARLMLLRWQSKELDVGPLVTNMVNAVTYAISNHASIINISGSVELNTTNAEEQGYKDQLEAVFKMAEDRNVLVVASARNDGLNLDDPVNVALGRPIFSAPVMFGFNNIICVTASTPEPEKLYRPWGTNTVDIAAPGFNIYSLKPINGFCWNDGTSFSAPMVSGAAALIWGMMPKLTAVEVRCLLLSQSRPIPQANIEAGKEWGHTPPATRNGVLDLEFVKDAYDAYNSGTPYGSCCLANAKDRPSAAQ